MRKIYVVGIGAGDPDHLTLQAAKAIGRSDVFFLLGGDAGADTRLEVQRRIIKGYSRPSRRMVDASAITTELIGEHLADGETGSFLVWGDPSLGDGTVAALDEIRAGTGGDGAYAEFEYEVIPGVSIVSALAAKHRVGLHRDGRPVQVITGDRLADEGWPAGVRDLVVLGDERQAFLGHPEAEIYWGAYLSTEDEILRGGRVSDVGGDIVETRAEARERHGWIVDTYLLRQPDKGREDDISG